MVVPESLAEKATSQQQSEEQDGVGEVGMWGGAARAGDAAGAQALGWGTRGALHRGEEAAVAGGVWAGKVQKTLMRTEWVQGRADGVTLAAIARPPGFVLSGREPWQACEQRTNDLISVGGRPLGGRVES